jgi:hypothetical protein
MSGKTFTEDKTSRVGAKNAEVCCSGSMVTGALNSEHTWHDLVSRNIRAAGVTEMGLALISGFTCAGNAFCLSTTVL